MSKFNIIIDVPDPPKGYGPPEWCEWEKGFLWLRVAYPTASDIEWVSESISGKRIICRPLPKQIKYICPDITKDHGKDGEWSLIDAWNKHGYGLKVKLRNGSMEIITGFHTTLINTYYFYNKNYTWNVDGSYGACQNHPLAIIGPYEND